MSNAIPAWALRAAAPEDHAAAQAARAKGTLEISWPDQRALRGWARQRGWPTPWLGFEEAFIAQMLSTGEQFAQALQGSGVGVRLPRQQHTLPDETLRALDALYASRAPGGRPDGWDALVAELREIRRAVEAGVAVQIAGEPPMRSWQQFYQWAHGRYHMLEDGADKWIGDDA